ncbi:MAG: MFS transporter [Beijerinckiaceae bacterium]
MSQAFQSGRGEPAYRWVILIASSAILAVVMGQLVNGLSIYLVPLETEYGWKRGDISLINTIGLIGIALGSLVLGHVADRFGVRRIALFGVAAAGLAMLAAAWADALWQFYLLFFIAGAFGGGALSAPLMALVGNWFVNGAGFAIGAAAAGQALGQGLVPFVGAYLIDAMGWRVALAAQSIAILVVLMPLTFLLRDPPRVARAGGALPDESPSGLPNWLVTAWLSLAVLLCCTCMSVPLIHLVPLMQICGIPAPQAGGVLFSMLLVAIAGRVAFGRLADLIGAIPAYLIASGWQTLLVFGFTFLDKLDSFYLYAAVYGFGYAGVMTALLVTARNLTAPARRASSMGVIMAFAFAGHGLGGWQGGFFFDQTGAYTWSYANAAFAGIANVILISGLWIATRQRFGRAMAAV